MWSSLGLTLLVGLCVGVVADRLILMEDTALADDGPRGERPVWFLCSERGSLSIEEEPGYFYPADVRNRLLEGLSSELELGPEQVEQLEAYLEEGRHDAHEFWESSRHAFQMTADVDSRENELIESLRSDRGTPREAD
jgi:hypothetical protein